MKTFKYKAITPDHLIKVGELHSNDLTEARQWIKNRNWQLVDIREKFDWNTFAASITGRQLPIGKVSVFCYNMAVIVESGVNLLKGIDTLLEQAKDRHLKQLLTNLMSELERGNLLSAAMNSQAAYFPPLLMQMVASGEMSGNLDTVFYSMANYYERENTIREKIKSASAYPIILGCIAVGLLVFFMTFILPSITDLVSGNNGNNPLPWITRAVINLSGFLTSYFFILIPVLIAVIAIILYFSRKEPFIIWRHRFILKLPLFGEHIRNLITAQFSGMFGMYLASGIPISTGLASVEDLMNNRVAKSIFHQASERVLRGESLTSALRDANLFDSMTIEMMRVGEEAGNLEEMLQKLSNQYDKKVQQGIEKMVSLIEPVFTILIGGFIAVLVVAIAIPMMNLSNVIGGSGG